MTKEEVKLLTTDRIYDVAIVGSGPAGYSAAVQSAWVGLSAVVFRSLEAGGQLILADRIEKYPGLSGDRNSPDLAYAMEEQAVRLGAEMRTEGVVRADLSVRPFGLWAEGKDEPTLARTVIVATGVKARWLGVEGERRLIGLGVGGCATCEGFFFRDKKVAVVGGGNRAMEDALFLARYAREVVVVHRRDRFRASGTLLGQAQSINVRAPDRNASPPVGPGGGSGKGRNIPRLLLPHGVTHRAAFPNLPSLRAPTSYAAVLLPLRPSTHG